MNQGWYAGRDPYHNPHETAHHYTDDGFGDGGVTRTCDGRGSVVQGSLDDTPVMVNGEPAHACPRCERERASKAPETKQTTPDT